MKQMMRMIIIIIDKHFHNHISSHGGLAVETINRQSGADGERETTAADGGGNLQNYTAQEEES